MKWSGNDYINDREVKVCQIVERYGTFTAVFTNNEFYTFPITITIQQAKKEIEERFAKQDAISKPSAADILLELSELYRQRNKVYGDNFKKVGALMAALFPDGILLKTEQDHNRFHLFMLSMVKVTRYTNNWTAGHSDSIRDAAVYMAMLDAVDADNTLEDA